MDSLDTLLTVDGLKFLKELSLRNLDYRAEDSKEVAMLNSFLQKAKDVRFWFLNVILKSDDPQEGWLCKQSGKADKDIRHQFRAKKNYLRAQVWSFVTR